MPGGRERGGLRDLQLIGAAQRVEHYEVAAYGTARAIAERLGLGNAAFLLAATLEEEEAADNKLTEVAEGIYDQVDTGAADGGQQPAEPSPRKAPAAKKAIPKNAMTRKR